MLLTCLCPHWGLWDVLSASRWTGLSYIQVLEKAKCPVWMSVLRPNKSYTLCGNKNKLHKDGRGKGLAGSDATDQGREKTPVKVGMAVFLCCEAMIKNHTYPHDGTVGQKSADIGIYQGSRMHCKNGKCGRHPASSRGCCHCSVVTLFSAKLRRGLSIFLNPAFQAATTSGLGLA